MSFQRRDSGIGYVKLFVGVLKLIKPPIEAAQAEELVVRPHLAKFAMMHDDDAVAFLDR